MQYYSHITDGKWSGETEEETKHCTKSKVKSCYRSTKEAW